MTVRLSSLSMVGDRRSGLSRNLASCSLRGNNGSKWKRTFIPNVATGGTVTDVANYNGTGQKWRVHTFRSGGTFVVNQCIRPFTVLLVGNGGNGGNLSGGNGGGGGGGGGVREFTALVVRASYTVGVGPVTLFGLTASNGNSGQGDGNGMDGGASGAPTSNSGGTAVIPEGGGGGGSGGSGQSPVGNGGGGGGSGLTRTTSGTSVVYGAGGPGGDDSPTQNGFPGKGFAEEQTGGAIIAYRIA